MTKTKTIRKSLMALFVSLSILWAMCLSCVSLAAETGKTFQQTMEITQTILTKNEDGTVSYGSPTRNSYTYRLYPNNENTPLPEGEGLKKDAGYYEFVLTGDAKKSIPVTFTVDGPVDYQYRLERVEAVPKGDIVTPTIHHFGYLFKVNSENEITITPYTCYDNHFKIWDKTDAEGNPIGITLENNIQGPEEKNTPSDGKDGKDGQDGKNGIDGKDGTNGKNGTDGKNGTNGTNGRNGTNGTNGTSTVKTITQTVGKAINTGDPNHILLWGGLIVLSAGALVAILIVRRKKEKDEETN